MTTPNPDRRIGEEKPMNTHQTSEAGEILPCPFCGGTARYKEWSDAHNETRRAVYCTAPMCLASMNLAIDQTISGTWNTRPAESHLRAQLAEAEQWRSQHGNAYQQVMGERDAARNVIDNLRAQLADALNRQTALRGQLAEVGKHRDEAEKRQQEAGHIYQQVMNERDAAQARVGEMEGLLREARGKFIDYEMIVDEPAPYAHRDLMDRIDAALATSPHRLAGRGE